jgi:hypothetical protein
MEHTMSNTTTTSVPTTPREIVVACLHHSGACAELASVSGNAIQARAREMCDGFGDGAAFAAACATDPDCFWDWSHVRDSSPYALIRASRYLTRKLAEAGEIAEALELIATARAAKAAAS